jgi:hypothetical protein
MVNKGRAFCIYKPGASSQCFQLKRPIKQIILAPLPLGCNWMGATAAVEQPIFPLLTLVTCWRPLASLGDVTLDQASCALIPFSYTARYEKHNALSSGLSLQGA